MRPLSKAILAALWTGALILTVVVAVDGQEQARHDQDVREETRTQVDLVRSNLEESMARRVALAERLAAFVDAGGSTEPEGFSSYAASIAATQPGVRSLRLMPVDGDPLTYPAGSDGAAVAAVGPNGAVGDPRVVGPFQLPSGARALVIITPVYSGNLDERDSGFWGTAWVEVYLEPILGEAKLVGWPGDAVFALRGTDGQGENGVAFHGDAALFAAKPVTAAVAFHGGQWQLAGAPSDGWPELAPASLWIRIGGGILALMASVLVGVLVSEPNRLREAVIAATKSVQENEERFRSVSDTAQDAIVTVDQEGRITYANRAAEGLYGQRREDLVGAHVRDRLDSEAALLRQLGSNADPFAEGAPVELLSHRRDGSPVPVEMTASSWELAGHRYQTAIIRDITERKRQQDAQARLAAVLDTTPDFVAIADPRGRLEYANRAARRVLDLEPEEVSSRGLIDLFPEDHRQILWEEALPEALRSGAWRGESTLLAADGRRIPVSQVLLAHKGADERVSAVALLARDTTDEKAAEEAIQREKERFRTLSDAALEGIVIHEDGVILETNQAFARLTGAPHQELVGARIIDLIAPESRAKVQGRLTRPRDLPYEVELLRRDGTTLTVEVAAKQFPYKDRIVRVAAVRDVTERKKAEAAQRVALERLNEIERLKEIDQFKTQLLNTASHELNTPITPIRLQLHLLKNTRLGDLSVKHRKAIDVLDRNVERLAILVQDVLDVARLQSGHLKLCREPIDVDTVVREAVEAFEEPARQAEVRLDTDIQGDLWVVGDGHRLTQVLFNLLSNALKFTPAKGDIRVVARKEAGRAVVRVIDTGQGLDELQIRRLFRPFSQVHDTMQTTRAGTGLGLYISKGIIDEHAGMIRCDSDGPGLGATFTFSIPLGTPDELAESAGAPEAPTPRPPRG